MSDEGEQDYAEAKAPDSEKGDASKPGPRSFSQEELDQILLNHREWIDSRYGTRPGGTVRTATRADLQEADLFAAELSGTDLQGANFQGADLRTANLQAASLIETNLQQADLFGANLQKAILIGANLKEANLIETNLQQADLSRAVLRGAYLSSADLRGAELQGADLQGAHFGQAVLTGATFVSARIDARTTFARARFEQGHSVLADGSDTIKLPFRDTLLNWATIRGIGVFPFFGVSWAALAFSVILINVIGWGNERLANGLLWLEEHWPIAAEAMQQAGIQEIPIPARTGFALIATLLLVTGSTLYRIGCPTRVQAYSEIQYVEELGRPRLLYLEHKIRRRWLQLPTLIFTGAGATLAVGLVVERLIQAIRYML